MNSHAWLGLPTRLCLRPEIDYGSSDYYGWHHNDLVDHAYQEGEWCLTCKGGTEQRATYQSPRRLEPCLTCKGLRAA